MNKDVDKLLTSLQKRGFTVAHERGGVALIAPNGNRRGLAGDFKALRAWAEKEARVERRAPEKERDYGGVRANAIEAGRTSRRFDNTLIYFDRLPLEQQIHAVREMLHRLGKSGVDGAFPALKEMGG